MRDPYLQVMWSDAETGARGYVVIDTLVRGLAGGGLRMRPGCTLAEVGDLARAMTRKEAIAYRPGFRTLPIGGGKGGIDFDPRDPRARGVLARFLEAMRPLITTVWATGEDLGVHQDELDAIALELGLRSTVEAVLHRVHDGAEPALARVARGFAASDRGIGLGDLVGGYGVARAALAALTAAGRDPAGATAVVQGFGSIGGASARYLVDAGVRVIGVADADGMAVGEQGLDVEALLRTRDRHGRFDRDALRADDGLVPRDAWSTTPCDILVPAATSYVIDERCAEGLPASVVAEAANVAISSEAEALLARRGVHVVPDFIANMGTNAWWWWTLFGDIEPTPEHSFATIAEVMDGLVGEALRRTRPGEPLRAAALRMADERLAEAIATAGGSPA